MVEPLPPLPPVPCCVCGVVFVVGDKRWTHGSPYAEAHQHCIDWRAREPPYAALPALLTRCWKATPPPKRALWWDLIARDRAIRAKWPDSFGSDDVDALLEVRRAAQRLVDEHTPERLRQMLW